MNPDIARPTGEAVLTLLRSEAVRYGVSLPVLLWNSARFEAQKDPSTGESALLARWQAEGRNVNLTLRPDGHIYGECDLLVDHPKRPGFWIDTLAVWGVPPGLKFEPNLIAKPE